MDKAVVLLAYKLVNFAFGKTLSRELGRPWKDESSGPRKTLREITNADVLKAVDAGKRHQTRNQMVGFLDHYCTEKGILVLAREKRGQSKYLDFNAAMSVQSFVFDTYTIYAPGHDQGRFELNELLSALVNAFACRHTIEHGSENSSFNVAMRRILSKDDSFFLQGYIYDFFVHDRFSVEQEGHTIGAIYCREEYISTMSSAGDGERSGYLQFKIAA